MWNGICSCDCVKAKQAATGICLLSKTDEYSTLLPCLGSIVCGTILASFLTGTSQSMLSKPCFCQMTWRGRFSLRHKHQCLVPLPSRQSLILCLKETFRESWCSAVNNTWVEWNKGDWPERRRGDGVMLQGRHDTRRATSMLHFTSLSFHKFDWFLFSFPFYSVGYFYCLLMPGWYCWYLYTVLEYDLR